MSVEQTITDISALPVDDQLRIIQAVWDRLPPEAGTALSDQQRQELDRRWATYLSDPSSALSEQDLRRPPRRHRLV